MPWKCCVGPFYFGREIAQSRDFGLSLVHYRLCDNCHSCTTREVYRFSSAVVGYGNSTRLKSFLFVLLYWYWIQEDYWRINLIFDISIAFTAFLLYVASVMVLVLVLAFHFTPLYGHSNVLVFTGICSLMGSLSVIFSSFFHFMFLCDSADWFSQILVFSWFRLWVWKLWELPLSWLLRVKIS